MKNECWLLFTESVIYTQLVVVSLKVLRRGFSLDFKKEG